MNSGDSAFDLFQARATIETESGSVAIYRIMRLEELGIGQVSQLPYSIRVLLESVLRQCDGFSVTEEDVRNLASWEAESPAKVEIPFKPARVVLQDFTGVPAVVDLAAMRSAMKRLGGDPNKINPLIPVDLVIDHSVQVDRFGSADALEHNIDLEFQRNRERYEFLRWGQQAFDNFRVVPPNVGIVHQVNLEFLAKGVFRSKDRQGDILIPDTLVGTDSHTTMINGLGVVGWGVGGIEAEAVMLGQPLYMLMPEVVGFELTGELPAGATATDLVLKVTEQLRQEGVVGKFVEFYGSGVARMSLADRATIANMAPEYGATMGFFPVDDEALDFLRRTGREPGEVELVEQYTKELGIFRSSDAPVPKYSKTLSLDAGTVEPALAGPKRPQDRVPLAEMSSSFASVLQAPVAERGFGLDSDALESTGHVQDNGSSVEIGHGAVVIAAITSCTNTSNPSVMLAAGILAQKAVARGLRVKPYVKTSLAPGSRVVSDYLDKAGCTEPLEELGFHTVGYGCTSCIGNSGPLPEPVAAAIEEGQLVAAAVLSGNRNFEGRVNPLTKANYLASPPLVVAYALAGSTSIDLASEPLGKDSSGQDVYLKELWPSTEEIQQAIAHSISPEMFRSRYGRAFDANETWNRIEVSGGELYGWDAESTYGSRRGNDRVMLRGTFANIRIRNQLAPGTEGGWTRHFPSGDQLTIYDAAMRYQQDGVQLVVLAGSEYGTGSSRDWAAKGTLLMGVKAVIAASYERIHRSNLVGMGVLPLEFPAGETWQSLGLTGEEEIDIQGLGETLQPRGTVKVLASREGKLACEFEAAVRIDTPVELDYYRNGGILQTVLRNLLKASEVPEG
jgi:aconitate hydratase